MQVYTYTYLNFAEKPGPPDAPTISEIFKTSCLVSWKPPSNDGGSPIIGYHLERRMTSSTRWVKINKEILKELTMAITDLMESSDYEFRVSAENKAGIGEPSPPSKPFTAKDPWGEYSTITFEFRFNTGLPRFM